MLLVPLLMLRGHDTWPTHAFPTLTSAVRFLLPEVYAHQSKLLIFSVAGYL